MRNLFSLLQFLRIGCVLFSWTDSDMCMFHLSV